MGETIRRGLHLLALGMWFGGAAFFNFFTATTIFESFRHVVNDGPTDRTAYLPIISATASDEDKKALASALAGSAVGPVFPKYFAMQAVCGLLALATAIGWRDAPGRIHRWRVRVLVVAVLTVVVAWPISNYVSELRVLRFAPDLSTREAAVAGFGPWHLVSLLLSFVTVTLAGIALAMAGKLPKCCSEQTTEEKV
jgi:hypothetical protein